ncbi:MAG: hypothetical protein J3K34DRAFT_402465 [Monoraphidium minutum]|nr:MAG: hypothetical protein J3K34DRAFT_402465 [Monoraphidium minutum]
MIAKPPLKYSTHVGDGGCAGREGMGVKEGGKGAGEASAAMRPSACVVRWLQTAPCPTPSPVPRKAASDIGSSSSSVQRRHMTTWASPAVRHQLCDTAPRPRGLPQQLHGAGVTPLPTLQASKYPPPARRRRPASPAAPGMPRASNQTPARARGELGGSTRALGAATGGAASRRA